MSGAAPPVGEVCSRCGKALTGDDRVAAGEHVFCRSCYDTLRHEVHQAVEQMSSDVPYPMAALGAVLGGAAGAAIWWGFTVVTKISFGLIAVAIGYLVGHGAVRFAGGKRSRGLQILALIVAVASFVAATYLVNRTFFNRQFAEQTDAFRIGLVPQSFDLFVKVVSTGFGLMDWVFLAITAWQAWSIPKPIALPRLEPPAA